MFWLKKNIFAERCNFWLEANSKLAQKNVLQHCFLFRKTPYFSQNFGKNHRKIAILTLTPRLLRNFFSNSLKRSKFSNKGKRIQWTLKQFSSYEKSVSFRDVFGSNFSVGQLQSRVARFSWNNTPKRVEIYQITTTLPKGHKIYQIAVKYS
jgi:hypothetical protein